VKVRIRHVHRNRPLVKEYRPNLELPTVAHGKPYAILELLICHGKAEPFNVGAQQDFDRLEFFNASLLCLETG
jgi:hypothetical protein